eukprot:487031-Alexandrium_andersonii.AAC.1
MKGDTCRFVAALAGYTQTYNVRAACCRGGIRFVEGGAGEISDVLDMIGYDEDTSDWYRAIHMQLTKSCDQAGRAHLGTLNAITQRRCFVVTHGECGAGRVRQAITESTGGDVYAYE